MTKLAKAPKYITKAFREAVKARKFAHAPHSKFKVGAALITPKGKVFTGCNVENASYGATICAERTAVLKAVSVGQKCFSDVIVVAESKYPTPPCGECLQVLAEFVEPGAMIWLAKPSGIIRCLLFSEVFPYPFSSKYL